MEVIGKVKVKGDTQTIGAKGFRKRELVIVTDEQYPQPIMVEFVQDKCDLLDKYKEGDSVKVSINLRGRGWVNPQGDTKYFNQIQGWRIEEFKDAPTANTPPAQDLNVPSNEPNDLPFN
jgi:hypothetical protein